MLCRLCSNPLLLDAGFTLLNVPSIAQYLHSNANASKVSSTRLTVTTCEFCKLVQTMNPPVHYFRESIRNSSLSPTLMGWRRTQFSTFVSNHKLQEKNVLEVGCGKGELLEIMKDLNVNVVGTEFNPEFLEICRGKELQVWKTYPTEPDFVEILGENTFDAFYTSQVLEHSPHPRDFLNSIRKTLKIGAVGLVEVPNYEMIERDSLIYEFMTDHITYFSKESLSLLLQLSGFEVIGATTHFNDYVLSLTVGYKKSNNLGSFIGRLENDQNSAKEFLENRKRSRLVLWGAGHQAFAATLLLGLDEHLSYVVDSSPDKQGKFVPGTSLQILSPEVLFNDVETDCVIVAAGGYNQEIVDTLQFRLQNQTEIFEFKSGKFISSR